MARNSKGQFNNEPRPEKRKGRFKECEWKDCNIQIWVKPYQEKVGYGKYHNRICRGLAERGIIWSTKGLFKKGFIPWNKGVFGELNGAWKGNDIGYAALHSRISRRFPRPKKCQRCNKKTTKLDLSNISWRYLDDISDWEWICKSCHNKKDWRNGGQASKVFEIRNDGTFGKRKLI